MHVNECKLPFSSPTADLMLPPAAYRKPAGGTLHPRHGR